MKKNTKSILAIIMAIVVFCTIFVACSKNNDEPVDNDISVVDTSNTSETVPSTEDQTKAEAQTSTTEKATETTTTKEQETTTKKETTTAKKQETTTKKKVETTTKKKVETTTKKKVTTTKKKETTTKKAVKNVTPQEVQKQVNAYIKSKGIPVNDVKDLGYSSMTPSNSGWSGGISASQESLNEGYSLKTCKKYVDYEINVMGDSIYSMYCYYGNGPEGKCFYILYT